MKSEPFAFLRRALPSYERVATSSRDILMQPGDLLVDQHVPTFGGYSDHGGGGVKAKGKVFDSVDPFSTASPILRVFDEFGNLVNGCIHAEKQRRRNFGYQPLLFINGDVSRI